MSEPITLYGMTGSVYTRVAQIVLREKELSFEYEEIDPFELPLPAFYAALHPFGRVPVLKHGEFALYETQAITTYLDTTFPGPSLIPSDDKARARMIQVISIVDAYGYWPLVRQVFEQRVWNALDNLPVDEAVIANGLEVSGKVIAALEAISAEGLVLNSNGITRADAHLAPMIDYFRMAPEGAAMLAQHPHLSAWWHQMETRASVRDTRPSLS
ncbi:MAG: glutathione S-transferase family protein [Pseudomonadota bacterium]